MAKILDVEGLRISFKNENETNQIVHGIDFNVNKGEILGIVGESGSGKSVSCLSLLQLLPEPPAKTEVLSCNFESHHGNVNLYTLNSKEIRNVRGSEISMIFQNPLSSLNPTHRCGNQVRESILLHTSKNKTEARSHVLELFELVGLPDPPRIYNSYPHQLSGGQIQRIMIAMALSCGPKLLIADEPTTALDVTVQLKILNLIKKLQTDFQMSVIFISHDLAVVRKMADRVVVMKDGEILEQGLIEDVFNKPKDPYTKGLIACRPPLNRSVDRLPTIADFAQNGDQEFQYKTSPQKIFKEELLNVSELSTRYVSKRNWYGKPISYVKAVHKMNLKIHKGETLGLVGESGSGKSTLGMSILRLIEPFEGKVIYDGIDVLNASKKDLKFLRKRMQIIFQNPFASLNPRLRIGEAILEPMIVHGLHGSAFERKKQVTKLLDKVGLSSNSYNRFPHEFSGGQRQRISIARTLAVEPQFIVCDECVSALDVSVQAQVLNLLKDLQEELGLSYLFISHDMSVVRFMSDRIAVMKDGELMEKGYPKEILENPQSAYTASLIEAIPKF